MASQSRNAPIDKATNDAIQAAINRTLAQFAFVTVNGQAVRGPVEIVTEGNVKATVSVKKIVISAK